MFLTKVMSTTNIVDQPYQEAKKGLRFIAAQDNSSVCLNKVGNPAGLNFFIMRNNSRTWQPYTCGSSVVLQHTGDYILMKGQWNSSSRSFSGSDYYQFSMTGKINSKGNLFSLYNNITSLYYCNCYRLFMNCSSLITPPELPATTLVDVCYNYMFTGCTSLVTAPALPATTLAGGCYADMFSNCKSLVNAPELPATTLAGYCYYFMFSNCISLTTAPELPASTLAPYCYQDMFRNCTSLSSAFELPATTLVQHCYNYMFVYCQNINNISVGFTDWNGTQNITTNWLACTKLTGIFTCLEELLQIRGQHNIPNNWTIIRKNRQLAFKAVIDNSAISLNKIGTNNLVNMQYQLNFGEWNTYNFNTVIPLSTNQVVKFKGQYINRQFNQNNYYQFTMTGLLSTYGVISSLYSNSGLIDYQYYKLFEGCSSLINTPKLEYTTLANNCYNSMFKGCINLSSVLQLPATLLVDNCYNSMFKGCTNLSAAPQLPATTLANNCYNSMFKDCINLTQISNLPATSLVDNCYKSMFQNCTNLSSVSVSFTDWNDQVNATQNWLNNVAYNGQFYCPPGLVQIRDNSHVPVKWDFYYYYKKQLNYLQSTKTQWIDTNIIIGSNDNFSCDAKISISQFGGGDDCFLGVINDNFGLGIQNKYTNASYKKGVGGVTPAISYQVTLNTLYNIHLQNGLYKLNNIQHHFNPVTNYVNNWAITLFGASIGSKTNIYGKSAVRIHEVKFYNNGTLVGHFIPVLDFNNTPCMFDKVTKQLFYNQGTGQFLYSE